MSLKFKFGDWVKHYHGDPIDKTYFYDDWSSKMFGRVVALTNSSALVHWQWGRVSWHWFRELELDNERESTLRSI
jgi:hypothetical protein